MRDQRRRLRTRPIWLVIAAGLIVLTGACSSGTGGPAKGTGAPAKSAPTVAVSPAAATAMVCQQEAQNDITESLGLPPSQPLTSTWADRLFTCTYRYGDAAMLVSVKELPDKKDAEAYFTQQQTAATGAIPFPGIGDAAFTINNGSTFVRKDNFVLRVDVSGLPDTLGPKSVPRNHVGIAVASVIIGCWVEG